MKSESRLLVGIEVRGSLNTKVGTAACDSDVCGFVYRSPFKLKKILTFFSDKNLARKNSMNFISSNSKIDLN